MHSSVNQAYAKIFKWLENNPTRTTLPYYIESAVNTIQRYDELNRDKVVVSRSSIDRHKLKEEIESGMLPRAERRQAEQLLADYIDNLPAIYKDKHIRELVDKLKSCRTKGLVKQIGDQWRVIFDDKCNEVRLCPDEAREETQRLAARYVPVMQAWLDEHWKRRIHYSVLTLPHAQPGHLADQKKKIFEKLKTDLLGCAQYCPVMFVDGPACKIKYIKNKLQPGAYTKQTKEKLFPTIKGAFVTQEDPLSQHHNWNVHLNVLFMTEGPIDYKEIRQAWGGNVHIDQVEKQGLTSALIEIVKYSAQIVPTKSTEKKQKRKSEAPAMIEWPAALWVEWWSAQKPENKNGERRAFRRTRSYGCLNRIKVIDDDDEDLNILEEGRYIGSFEFSPEVGYSVDLTPADNFYFDQAVPRDNFDDDLFFHARGDPP